MTIMLGVAATIAFLVAMAVIFSSGGCSGEEERGKMATEKRLIDANAFKIYLEEIRQEMLEENTMSSDFAAEVIETVQDEYLQNAPIVDAVEVVRCGKCSYYEDGKCFHPKQENGWNSAGGEHLAVKISDFCSYGERRTNV